MMETPEGAGAPVVAVEDGGATLCEILVNPITKLSIFQGVSPFENTKKITHNASFYFRLMQMNLLKEMSN